MSEDARICCGCDRNARQLDYIEDGAWMWTWYGDGQLCPECSPRFQVHEEPEPPEPCPKCGGSGTVFEEWHALPGRCMQPCPECSGKVSLTNLIEGSWEGPPKSAAQAVNESRLDKAMREEASRRHQTPALPEAPVGCEWRKYIDDGDPSAILSVSGKKVCDIYLRWNRKTIREHVEESWSDHKDQCGLPPFPGWPSDQPTEEPVTPERGEAHIPEMPCEMVAADFGVSYVVVSWRSHGGDKAWVTRIAYGDDGSARMVYNGEIVWQGYNPHKPTEATEEPYAKMLREGGWKRGHLSNTKDRWYGGDPALGTGLVDTDAREIYERGVRWVKAGTPHPEVPGCPTAKSMWYFGNHTWLTTSAALLWLAEQREAGS